jgi:hypothetical protein
MVHLREITLSIVASQDHSGIGIVTPGGSGIPGIAKTVPSIVNPYLPTNVRLEHCTNDSAVAEVLEPTRPQNIISGVAASRIFAIALLFIEISLIFGLLRLIRTGAFQPGCTFASLSKAQNAPEVN